MTETTRLTGKPTTIRLSSGATIIAPTVRDAVAQLPPKFAFAAVFPDGMIDEMRTLPQLQRLDSRGRRRGIPLPQDAKRGDIVTVAIQGDPQDDGAGRISYFRKCDMRIVDIVGVNTKRDPDEEWTRNIAFAVLERTTD